MRLQWGRGTQPFVQIVDRATWADVEPPETLDAALKEAYGDTGPQLLDQLRHSCSKVVSELPVYRPELSYIPK
jgi:hypothetical protein